MKIVTQDTNETQQPKQHTVASNAFNSPLGYKFHNAKMVIYWLLYLYCYDRTRGSPHM